LLQKGKRSALRKFHNATGLFHVRFDPAYSVVVVVVVVVVVENREGKINKAFWSRISLLMMEAVIVSETLVCFNHLALQIAPNEVIHGEM
jgi:hypothetical protein